MSAAARMGRWFGMGRWLLMLAVMLLAACGKEPQEAVLPSGSVVLALGDSLTAGAGVSPEQAWPDLLATKTGWVVVNGGVSGDTSADALKRLPALLDEHSPALVLVALGGNDMLRHVPEQETVANLGRMLDQVKAHGAKAVLLATPKPSVAGAAFQNLAPPEFYKTVAERYQVPLIEDAIPEVLSDPQLKGDPLHPNVQGHELLAGKIFEELRAIGYVR
jgi:lysophospholipase L1-like esterase